MPERQLIVSLSGAASLPDPATTSPAPMIDCSALTEIVDGLARSGRTVPGSAGPAAQTRSRQPIRTEAYDVWLITWPPGSTIEMHSHGESTGVMRVAAGELWEWSLAGERRLGGDRAYVQHPGTAHRLVNLRARETMTVHAYSPPLRETTFYPELRSRSAHPAGRPGVEAEASSRPVLYAVT